jgi:putative SOS response-associated peptidase YedK
MCGRYIIRVQENAMKDWHVHAPPEWMKTSYNVAPTHEVPVVRVAHGERQGSLMRWGLIPFFARGEPPKYATINARVETVETAPSYKGAWSRGQRCIQVTSGFYEWHVRADGRKVPYFIHLADQDAFGFASLWDRSRRADGTWVESCALITLPANPLMHDIHNGGNNPHRMPAILRKEDREAWLTGSVEEARARLVQYPADLMVAYPVGPRVNKPENDDEKLLEPADDSGEPQMSDPADGAPQQQSLL